MTEKKLNVNMRKYASSVSGTYRAPYKSEGFFRGLITSIAAVLSIILVLMAAKVIRNFFMNDASDSLVILSISIIVVVIEILIIAIAVVITKSVCSGYKCTYIDDGDRFVTNEGGNHREIYYWEVKDVQFVPRTILGKVHGYEVTIVTEHRNEVYGVVSGGFISKESTPFYIVCERVEQYRAKKAREAYMKEVRSMNSTPVSLDDNSQNEDPTNRLGMNAEMPSVGLPKRTSETDENT